MAWFGHTQTLTGITKSVTTVASGIMGLEANLATFMRKVTYFEQFFERMKPNLPEEVMATAALLFARCYEYRAEIRDELESSLAYVADAGRWVIGMEDWNSKMEKRLAQISELVLLANTLLVEYAVTGQWGAQGAKDTLDGYLRIIADSVVLQNKPIQMPSFSVPAAVKPQSEEYENSLFPPVKPELTGKQENPLFSHSETNYNPLFPAPEAVSTESPAMSDTEGELFSARSSTGSGENPTIGSSDTNGSGTQDADDDDDALNPFARAYQTPVSIESSLASLRAESDNGSVHFNAVEAQQMSVMSGDGSSVDRENDAGEEPDSPVSLGEYECLEMDSIPQYVAFKPSALSRKRQLKQKFFGGPSTSTSPAASVESIAPSQATPLSSPPYQSPKGSPRFASGTIPQLKDRSRLMDLTYSYDFQREANFNPFASPATGATDPNDISPPPQFELSMRQTVATVHEDEESEIKEQAFGHDRSVHEVPDDRHTPPSDVATLSDEAHLSPTLKKLDAAVESEKAQGTFEVGVEAREPARPLASSGRGELKSLPLEDADSLTQAEFHSPDAADELFRLLSEDEPPSRETPPRRVD